MRYRVVHTTEYRYTEPVPLSHNTFHLRPRDTTYQTCHEHTLNISPVPAATRERIDFFGNHATWVNLQEPHEVLKIEAYSEVEVNPSPPPRADSGPTFGQAMEQLAPLRGKALTEIRPYTFDSHYVRAHPLLREYARPSFSPDRSLLSCVTELTLRIYDEFTFDPKATTVGTPVLEVLRHRRGVCQDFAHLQIGCLRSLGIPARYVSGYLRTLAAPGKPKLQGCDASHAWLSAYLPTLGWVELDPTNGLLPHDQHVTLAFARDYDDVSPIKGVLVGGRRHTMTYGVDVESIEPSIVAP